MLSDAGLRPDSLGGIVCGEGPGSFTSLRIAASLAKGLAHGAGIPLHAVSSLLLAAASAPASVWPVHAGRNDAAWSAVVHGDALRGERYVQQVARQQDGHVHAISSVQRVAFDDLDAFCAQLAAMPMPPDAAPGVATATATVVRIAVGASPQPEREAAVVDPSAAALLHVASSAYLQGQDLSAWEPAYGRLAEAQVVWERNHGHPLPAL
jgi:tRNA threonylcarbamoyladenosine biosynthesis protein TsaB